MELDKCTDMEPRAEELAYHICHDVDTFVDGALVPGLVIALSKPFQGPSNPPLEDAEYWSALVEQWNQLLPDGLSFWGKKVLLGLLTDNFMGVREIRAEKIRQMYFPERPSRLQAVFACKTLDDAKRYRTGFGAADASIWKVAAKTVVELDMHWMRPVATLCELDYNIIEYWKGEQSPEGPLWECLMIPPVQVIERSDDTGRMAT